MNARIDQIQRGAAMYFEEEICRKAVGPGQFLAYFALPSVPKIVEDKVRQFAASPLGADLVSEDGSIALDRVRDRAKDAMNNVGSLEIMGFRLNTDDVDSLYEYIRRA